MSVIRAEMKRWTLILLLAMGCEPKRPARIDREAPPVAAEPDAGMPDDDRGPPTLGPWSWQSPQPQGNTLNALWVPSETEAWAVGAFGTALRWDGSAWTA